MTVGDEETRQRKRRPAVSWEEELKALAQQFDSKLDTPGSEASASP
jgi:hypothetical protein